MPFVEFPNASYKHRLRGYSKCWNSAIWILLVLIFCFQSACAGESNPPTKAAESHSDSIQAQPEVVNLTFEQWLDSLPVIPLPVVYDHTRSDPKTVSLPWPDHFYHLNQSFGPGSPVGILHRDSTFAAVVTLLPGDDMVPCILTVSPEGDTIQFMNELYMGYVNLFSPGASSLAIIRPDLSIEVIDSGWHREMDQTGAVIDSIYFVEKKFWQILPDGHIVPKE